MTNSFRCRCYLGTLITKTRFPHYPIAMYKTLKNFGKVLDTLECYECNDIVKPQLLPSMNETKSLSGSTLDARPQIWTIDGFSMAKRGINTVVDDTMSLSLHVLTCASLRVSYNF